MNDYGKYALMHANGATWAEVFDAHAHDLSEKIREDNPIGHRKWSGAAAYAWFQAADLIDPEVTK